jgi:putative tricarboxylic transport membrane protein
VSLVFGCVGYLLRKYQWPLAPLLLCYILGPLLEKYLIQSLSMSGGSPLIFLQRGLALCLLMAAGLLFVTSLVVMRYTVRRVGQEVREGVEV